MGNIRDFASKAARKVRDFFAGTPSAKPQSNGRTYSDPKYKRTTTASRRAEAQANARYIHVSKPLVEVPKEMQRLLNLPPIIVDQGKGTTRVIGMNHMKAVADTLGRNNKQRRKIRSQMKRRVQELMAAGPAGAA